MLLPLLTSLSLSLGCTIVATDSTGSDHQFATVEWQDKSTLAKITQLVQTPFDANGVTTFKIIRDDGSILSVPAPSVTKSLAFKIHLIGETPVFFEVTTAYRREGLQISLSRTRPMPQPSYGNPQSAGQADEGPGGLMGLVSRYWYIPLIWIVFNMMKGGGGAAPAAAPAQ